MKKILSGLLVFSMLATSAVSFAAPVEARDRHNWRERDHGHYDYYDRGHQNRYYHDRGHRRHRGNSDAIAAGIIGLALGAIIVGAANDRNRGLSHVERCERRYRTYDRRTDTFIGRDGRAYYCNL
jgi:Ni/Co efflux regulator RcnB